ncbi:MAG: carboxypeptidase-like regulatory domain-containing protein [Flavobacteriales bacterium]|nr:carboxypeptidase-like regulatory domain-containing protein [Flavobacteriales bacterium]
MRSYGLLLLFVFLGYESFSQDIFKGRVINHSTRRPLPFANIGILHGNRGTCANVKGNYAIDLSGIKDKDTLLCSQSGFQPDTFIVGDFRRKFATGVAIIFLNPLPPPPVNIMDYEDDMTRKLLGSTSNSKSKTTNFVSNNLGTELGVTIRIKGEPTYLRDLSFNVVRNDYDSLLLRVNLYYLYRGTPWDLMHSEDIIVKAHDHHGKVSVNLLPYELITDEDFFVSLEWVTQLGEANNMDLLFSGGQRSQSNFCRRSSQGDWIQYKGLGPAINVTAIY